MTIHEERDLSFWIGVLQHPAVGPVLGAVLSSADIATIFARPDLLPLASEHGGFIFRRMDSLERAWELHTAYTPEGWGREVHGAAKAAFNRMFSGPCEVILTQQMLANPHSQPPRSFGFRQAGKFSPSPLGETKTWLLTREAWLASPGGRTSCH